MDNIRTKPANAKYDRGYDLAFGIRDRVEPNNHTTVTCSWFNEESGKSGSIKEIVWYSNIEIEIKEGKEIFYNLPGAADTPEIREEVRAWWCWKENRNDNKYAKEEDLAIDTSKGIFQYADIELNESDIDLNNEK